MIYRIATAPPGARGLVGIFPDWDGPGTRDAAILARRQDFAVLMTRNYSGWFLHRIQQQLANWGQHVDIICGWEPEKLAMHMLPLNPQIETLRMSAIHFDTFELLQRAREESSGQPARHDLFFAVARRPDELKQADLLVQLLEQVERPLRVAGYGRLPEQDLERIQGNPRVHFEWRGKASVADPHERLAFLTELARSRCLLMTSRVEGYARLVGEALFLGVPVLLNGLVLCENWSHLHRGNCRLFTPATFSRCLDEMLGSEWRFDPPAYEDGAQLLRRFFEDYLERRGLPQATTWHPLHFAGLNDLEVEP